MSATKRNTLVGATVLVSLIVLGWMLLKFGAEPAKWFAAPTMQITLISERVDGLNEGSACYFRGVLVGRIVKISRDPDNFDRVSINAEIDVTPSLPENLEGKIKIISMLSGASQLSLETVGGPPRGKLAANAALKATFIGSDLFPQEFRELAGNLKDVTRQFRDSDITGKIATSADKLIRILDSVNDLVGDEEARKNIKSAVANFKTTSDSARLLAEKLNTFADNLAKVPADASELIKRAQGTVERTEGHIDSISRQFSDRLAQTSKLLDTAQSIATKIDKGEGTAGAIVNDPKLYQTLVETSLELKASISDMKRLIEQWEQEGVSLKLK